ncbi:MAG: NnrU family protein [Rhodanobacteraceae bacterium]|nr:MAG: NnrU family protein [Rhodanobacteraceae bacterium]
MPILILGLVIFLGTHSVRIFADGWRTRMIARIGLKPWKAVYALVSLIGFVLLVYGFGLARHTPVLLYAPPLALQRLNALFVLMALVLFFASHAPPSHFKAWLHHPMAAGVALWAAGHLMATGFLHDVVLFGAFLLWTVVDFIAGRRRDRLENTQYAAGTAKGDIGAVVIGVVVWVLFAFWLHRLLIGVQPPI